jgi:hypothetical protein
MIGHSHKSSRYDTSALKRPRPRPRLDNERWSDSCVITTACWLVRIENQGISKSVLARCTISPFDEPPLGRMIGWGSEKITATNDTSSFYPDSHFTGLEFRKMGPVDKSSYKNEVYFDHKWLPTHISTLSLHSIHFTTTSSNYNPRTEVTSNSSSSYPTMFFQHFLVLFYVFIAATASIVPLINTASLVWLRYLLSCGFILTLIL